jgi:hypothetical protein
MARFEELDVQIFTHAHEPVTWPAAKRNSQKFGRELLSMMRKELRPVPSETSFGGGRIVTDL